MCRLITTQPTRPPCSSLCSPPARHPRKNAARQQRQRQQQALPKRERPGGTVDMPGKLVRAPQSVPRGESCQRRRGGDGMIAGCFGSGVDQSGSNATGMSQVTLGRVFWSSHASMHSASPCNSEAISYACAWTRNGHDTQASEGEESGLCFLSWRAAQKGIREPRAL